MAKKNNKTAHVLRLITTSEAPQLQDLEEQNESASALGPGAGSGLSFLSAPSMARPASFSAATPPQEHTEPSLAPVEAPVEALAENPIFEPEPLPTSKNLHMGITSYVNLNELAVSLLCGKIMKRMNNCTCKKCTAFVITHSASLLPEKFVSFIEGEAMKKGYAAENSKSLTAVILKACFRLKTHPLH